MLRRQILSNFGQHEHFEADFRLGLNGILGPNGSGKSTILSAAHFAFTGDSLTAKTQAEVLRFGATKGFVRQFFEIKGQAYEIQRGFGKGAKSYLKLPDGTELNKIPEIDKALLGIMGTNPAVLTNNVFAKQGAIDRVLDQTSTECLKELSQIFGLSAVEQTYRLLGTELAQYKMTPGLEDQLQETIKLFERAKEELARFQVSIEEHQQIISALKGPAEAVIEAAEKARAAHLSADQAKVALTRAQEGRANSEAEVRRTGQAISDYVGRIGALPTQERLQVARQRVQDLQVAAQAQTAYQLRVQDLKEALKALEVAGPAPMTAEEAQALEATAAATQGVIGALERALAGDLAEEAHPKKAEIQALRAAKQAEASYPQRSLSAREIELAAEIRNLQATSNSAGACPTCNRPFDGHADAVCAAKARLEACQVELKALSLKLQGEHADGLAAVQAARIAAEEAHNAAMERFNAFMSGKLAEKKAELAATSAKLAGWTTWRATSASAQERVTTLTEQTQTAPTVQAGPLEIAAAQTAAEAAADELSRYRLLEQAWKAAEGYLDQSQTELARAREEWGRWTDLPEPPAHEVVQKARDDLSIVSARTKSLEELTRQMGGQDAKTAHLEVTCDQLRTQLSRESRDREWVEIVQGARDGLHVSQYPKLVMQEYAQVINQRIAHYLDLLSSPFEFWLDPETMSFRAKFPNREHAAYLLSGAERVIASASFRLALADTFASELAFVALDEPSAYMDVANIQNLQNLFLDLKRVACETGRQIVLITHEPALMNFVDHVVEVGAAPK